MENNIKDKLMYNTLSLSHIDLDGISCQLVIDQHYPNNKQYNCNYDKIDDFLEYIEDNCNEYRPERVFITDLSFEKKQAIHLAHIVKDHPGVKFIYIDHHPYDEELMTVFNKIKKLENFLFIHSEKASATKLTYKFLDKIKELGNETLEKYVESVNAYDIWLLDSDHFKAGFVYNELFFKMKLRPYYFEMRDNFKLKDKHKEMYKELVKKKNEYFERVKNDKLIFSKDNKFFIFADEFKSWITLDYPGYDYYVIASTYSRISVRIAEGVSQEHAERVKNHIIKNKDMKGVISLGGHAKAFGVTLDNGTPLDTLIMHVQDIANILETI